MTKDFYFRIRGKRDRICDVDQAWFDKVRGVVFCKECDGLVRPEDCRSITVASFHAEEHLMYVPRCHLGVISRDLMSQLEPHGFEALHHITAVSQGNRALDTHCGFYPVSPLVIRGGVESTFRVCPVCGRLLYSPTGRCYVTSASVHERLPLYGLGGGAVLTSVALWDSLIHEPHFSTRLRADKIGVEDTPEDRLSSLQ